VEDDFKGNDLLFVAGGIGIAPLRSAIRYVFNRRKDYGSVDIIYGARSAADRVYADEIRTDWQKRKDTRVHLTIDRPEDGWKGHVGYVPALIKEIGLAQKDSVRKRLAAVCGPPLMIKYSLEALADLGFARNQIYTTLEMRMKCGVGQCGRCNIGQKYVCADGPVFRCDELDELPEEY
jgi:NAD(P)H-flavin reductase